MWPNNIQYPTYQLNEIASILNSKPQIINRTIKAYLEKDQNIKQQILRPQGRPYKIYQFSKQQIDFIQSNQTLDQQKVMSLKARAQRFSELFKQNNFKAWDLRKLYLAQRIKRKPMVSRLGRPNLKSEIEQEFQINNLQKQIHFYQRGGYRIILADESCFSPNSFQKARYWSNKNNPIMTNRKYQQQKMVVVLGFIELNLGKVHMHYKYRSFTSLDVIEAFQIIRDKYAGEKVAIFLDNASIHKSLQTRRAAACMRPEIPLIFNVPYRPDLNPLEKFWGVAKRMYRQQCDHLKTTTIKWDNMGMVEHVIDNIPDQTARNCANLFKYIYAAQPIKKLDWEPEPDSDVSWASYMGELGQDEQPQPLTSFEV